MNSNQVKQAFAAAGIKVRVADLGLKFRVCTRDESAHAPLSSQIAASLGLTDVLGALGGQINQAHELVAYKVGAIRRV